MQLQVVFAPCYFRLLWEICGNFFEGARSVASDAGSSLAQMRPGMYGEILFADVAAVDMGVYLGRGDVGMPQHLLDGTQVGAAL